MYENPSDLLKQIALGEDSVLELKSIEFDGGKITGPHRDGMADELAAMANTASGVIVLGVNDKTKAVDGLPAEKLDAVEGWIRSICNDLVVPPLDCLIRKMALPNERGQERNILRIDVPRSLFVHKSPNGYFRRIGSSKREMKPDVLARLFQQRSQAGLIRFDEQTVPNTSARDLNPQLWRRFRTSLSSSDDRSFLDKMKLTARDSEGRVRATVGGLLLASDAPEAFLSSAFIQAVCYRGEERGAAYQLDAKDIVGPLDAQIREACKFVERNMRVFAIKAPQRIETPQFSLNAVFEAVVNAAAHRDYSIYGSKIRLRLFSDRLELFSPGSLPNTMTVESLSERQATRNELISSLLARCPMNVEAPGSRRHFIMDKRGEGVPIIFSESRELSGKFPEYRLIDEAELRLTIFAAQPPHRLHENLLRRRT
ncbi:MAG: putative DNA binding domain-containing protein [Candidatus Adiutrix sp.]|jgi:predicted HTH transcriptional regulator|nr:putative DNA binding domain-containing protein [Candidatus Adiutrix sp.]